MGTPGAGEISALLRAWCAGDKAALDQLTSLLYNELRRIASRYRRDERPGVTLQTTSLVHETYLRLMDMAGVDSQHRAQFFALAAQLMRRILVDAARVRHSQKRGGDVVRCNLDEEAAISSEPDRFVLALNDSLDVLERLAPRQAKVVELRYFGGLTEIETADAMSTSVRTVRRDWQFARAWLMTELRRTCV
jgi:RNA polymerase sigma factor (TIGR02999 family)